MGLKNSPATFQRLMDEVLGEFRDFCQPYIDDVIIFSETFEAHLKHIELVLSEIDFLGHCVNGTGVRMQKRKISAIMNMKPPSSSAEVKRFLGLASYYRKFIRNFANRTHHLGLLAKSKAKFVWSDIASL